MPLSKGSLCCRHGGCGWLDVCVSGVFGEAFGKGLKSLRGLWGLPLNFIPLYFYTVDSMIDRVVPSTSRKSASGCCCLRRRRGAWVDVAASIASGPEIPATAEPATTRPMEGPSSLQPWYETAD